MSVSIPDFWRLAVESRLLTAEQCQQLAAEFAQMKGASSHGQAGVLIEWLISKNVLTRYQTTILASGRNGPFYYGDYKVYDRVDSPPLSGTFRAVHSLTSHPVILQFLTGAVTQDANQWAAAQSRIQTECSVKHPHLHRCFEAVDLSTFKFLAIEDLRGQSADQMIVGGKRLPPQEACRIVRCAAMALAYMHNLNLIHGDVRPQNLWTENGGNIKLIRSVFGPLPVNLAQPDQQLVDRSDYLAPEFTQPGKEPDALTDVYALGCSFYHLLAGRVPFPGGDLGQKLQQHMSQPIQPLENMGVPQPIAQMVTYMMAKNPTVRYQNAEQIAQQLGQFVDPNRVDIQQPAPKATLPAYEQSIAHRQSAVPSQAAPMQPVAVQAAAAAFPAVAATSGGASAKQAFVDTSSAADGENVVQKRYGKTKEEKDKEKIKKIGIGLAIAGGLLIALLVLLNGMRDKDVATNTPENTGTGTNNGDIDSGDVDSGDVDVVNNNDAGNGNGDGSVNTPPPATGRYVAVSDDGNLPWSPTTEGPPVNLSFLPSGSRVFMITRPADMLATAEGAKVVASLGPAFQRERSAWEAATGFSLSDVEQLTLSLHDEGSNNFPLSAMVVRLSAAADKQALLGKWGNPAAQDAGGQQYYSGRNGWSFYIPENSDGKTFVMATGPQIVEVIESKGAAPLTGRAMNQLLAASDSDRHFTLLFAPSELTNNLFRDGRRLSLGDPKRVREPIDWLLGDSIEAGMASLHFGNNTFAEMMMVGRGGQATKNALAAEMKDRMEQLPDRVEQYLVSLDPHPYWKMVAFRFPQMIRYLHRQTRIGAEGDIAVLNAILPSGAAHNIVFATEMALSSTPGAAPITVATTDDNGPKSLAEVLDVKLSIAFAQDSLEFSMQNIETEVKDAHANLSFPFAIKIIGGDLEKNGITRNQQIRDFAERDKTVSEILTSMVMKANPIKTVKQPSETDQQLIWVIGPDPDDAKRHVILITTRDAAKVKNYTLPSVFGG